MRRPVRRPDSRATTADMKWSVCRLPFISMRTAPSRARAAAARAASSSSSGVSTISIDPARRPVSAISAASLAAGPTSTGSI
ncbi:hypothetical protein D3C72_1960130 [compost metagenome]